MGPRNWTKTWKLIQCVRTIFEEINKLLYQFLNLQYTYDVPKQQFQEEKYSSWQRSLIGSQRLFFDKKKKLLRCKLLDDQKTKISVDRVQDLLQRLDQRKVN